MDEFHDPWLEAINKRIPALFVIGLVVLVALLLYHI